MLQLERTYDDDDDDDAADGAAWEFGAALIMDCYLLA